MESPQGLYVVGPLATFPSCCPCNAYAQKSYMVKASPGFAQLAAVHSSQRYAEVFEVLFN